jgi:plasmid stability protein
MTTLTISNLPDHIGRALRDRANVEHKSLDEMAVDALARGLGVSPLREKKRDLSFLTQGPPLEPEVIRALEDQRRIDPEVWQ